MLFQIESNQFLVIKKTWPNLLVLSLGAGLNILLNYFLIQIYGATGAAIATAICEISVTLILAVLAYRMHIVSFRKIVLSSWKYILAAVVMFVPIFFMQRWLGNAIWTFIVIMLVGIAVYFLMLALLRDRFFMNNVKNFIQIIKRKTQPSTQMAAQAADADNVPRNEDRKQGTGSEDPSHCDESAEDDMQNQENKENRTEEQNVQK